MESMSFGHNIDGSIYFTAGKQRCQDPFILPHFNTITYIN